MAIEDLNVTRSLDSGCTPAGKFSTDAVLMLNPDATADDVLALALARAHRLHELVDVLAGCKSGMAYEPHHIAELILGPAEDVRQLLEALQHKTRAAAE